jgi:hypothetical protein
LVSRCNPIDNETERLACGDATFTESMRIKVLEIMSKDNLIRFVEVEYRPHEKDSELDPARPRPRRPLGSPGIEVARLPTRDRNVLSKAPGLRVMGTIHRADRFAERAQETTFVY